MDFLLLPVWVHKKLSIRFPGLIASFVFVGCFDLIFYENLFKQSIFSGNFGISLFKLVTFMILALLVGLIDVVCTIYPIADFARMIGRRSEKYVNKRIPVIMMKSYALSHILLVVPLALYVYSGVEWAEVSAISTGQIRILFAVIITLIQFLPYFQLGILYRTISLRTRIQVFGKLILVFAAYFWMELSMTAIGFVAGLAFSFLKVL